MISHTSARRLAGVALAALLLLATRLAPVLARPLPAAGPRVVASTSVFADLVQQVGGDRLASVRPVVPAGVDVEDYDPRPEDLLVVAQADLLVMNGLALDRWVPKLVQSANPGVTTLVLSDGLPVLGVGLSDDDDIAQNGNPHFWLDPLCTTIYVQRIHDQLVAIDPAGFVAGCLR
jgi:zinc/manganese transport system substrate-binding protein